MAAVLRLLHRHRLLNGSQKDTSIACYPARLSWNHKGCSLYFVCFRKEEDGSCHVVVSGGWRGIQAHGVKGASMHTGGKADEAVGMSRVGGELQEWAWRFSRSDQAGGHQHSQQAAGLKQVKGSTS